MREQIIYIFLIILLNTTYTFAKSKSTDDHLSALKAKFPYVLLGEDYGLLTVNDLAANACGAESIAFDENRKSHHPSLYWQCFQSRTISFDCEEFTSDTEKGLFGLIAITAKKDKEQHNYIERRPWPIKNCKQFIRDAARLIKGTKYACMTGSFIDKETDDSGQVSKSWMFEKIKTRKGCEGNGCEFTQKLQQENCPDLKF